MRLKKVILACMVCVIAIFALSITDVAFAEDKQPETISPNIVKEGNVIRESQKYPDVQYKPMTYVNEKWYWNTNEMLENLKAAWKEIFWFANLLLAKVGCEIVFNLFSLDIVDKTAAMVAGVMGATAKAVAGDFLLFMLSLTSGYIAIRAYVQQNWGEFFRILSKTIISLALLYSLFGSSETYVTFGNDLSKYMENMALKINPSMTASQKQDFESAKQGDTLKSSEIGAKIENKVFDAMVYKPFLLLNYGTTDEAKLIQDDKERITKYLQANEFNEKGLEKRKDIAKDEYEEKGNSTILANNVPSQVGSLFVSFVTNLVQIVVYFILALVRIVLQLAFIVLLIGLPLVLVFSLFPAAENIVMGYIKGLFSVITFKALTVFVVLIAVSFLSLGYDLTNASDKAESRIFTQLVITVATIMLWFKRDFITNALNGQHSRIMESAAGTVGKMGNMAAAAGNMAGAAGKKTLNAIKGQQGGSAGGEKQGGKRKEKPHEGWGNYAESAKQSSKNRQPGAEEEAAAGKENESEHEIKNDNKEVSDARHAPNLDKQEQQEEKTHDAQQQHTESNQEKVSDSRKPQSTHKEQQEQEKQEKQEKQVGNNHTEQSEQRSPQDGKSTTEAATEKKNHMSLVSPVMGRTTNRNGLRNPNLKNQEQQGNKHTKQARRVSGQRVSNVSNPSPATPTSRVESPRASVQRNAAGGRRVSGQKVSNISNPSPATPTSRVESSRASVQRNAAGGRRVSGQRVSNVSNPVPPRKNSTVKQTTYTPREKKAKQEKSVRQPRTRQRNSIPSLQQDIKRERIKSRVKK
ncbi:CD3337/EF1877 family mobilome membrane protein [Bacillus pseudomycoides]|uniref:CD3337/EF1877 family mobilome membrane protein n=1 Tax=Bacillus pseudomycoides TaxID=64104 RepID=UPI000BF100B9|nr:type IV secretion system protein [Bacillus pseudomycoides]PEK34106.1 hypothetical protein CN691_12885 [Bacillus pseudomycoides]